MAKPRRLGDKKYMIVYDVPPRSGKARQQKREILSGVTKQEAEAILAKRIEAVKRDELRCDVGMTMSELFDKFMAAKRRRLEPTSIARYESLIATYLRPTFGAMELGALRRAHLLEAYDRWETRAGRRPSGRTIRHAHDLLRAILNWAMSLDYIERNVAARIAPEFLPKALKPESAVLTEREVHQLLEEANNPTHRCTARHYLTAGSAFYPAVAFALYTGARLGEIMEMRWQDVDVPQQIVAICRSLSSTKQAGLVFKRPKNNNARQICVSARLLAILHRHQAVQAAEKIAIGAAYRDEGLIFAKTDGAPIAPWLFSSAFRNFMKRSAVRRIRSMICATRTPRCSPKRVCRSRSSRSAWGTAPSASRATATSPSTVTGTPRRRTPSRGSSRRQIKSRRDKNVTRRPGMRRKP